MIKTLRKRFIRIAMLAVTAVLLALCLIVNAANYISVDNSCLLYTSQCNEDIALMRTIPCMVVINPADDVEAKAAVKAAAAYVGPVLSLIHIWPCQVAATCWRPFLRYMAMNLAGDSSRWSVRAGPSGSAATWQGRNAAGPPAAWSTFSSTIAM